MIEPYVHPVKLSVAYKPRWDLWYAELMVRGELAFNGRGSSVESALSQLVLSLGDKLAKDSEKGSVDESSGD